MAATDQPLSEQEIRSQLEENHRAAFGWSMLCCDRKHEDAEDVLQTVYLKVLGGKARFNGASSFRTWLFALIRNTAVDQRRSLIRRLLREPQAPAPQPAVGPDRRIQQAEEAEILASALTRVSARQREVLHLVFYQGMTIEAAAEVMGVSIGSGRTHYERGKAKLRELLKEVLR